MSVSYSDLRRMFSVKMAAVILMLLLVASLMAGKYVAEFTEIGISARASGMGVAFTSEYGGAQSQFYNPAGLSGSSGGYLIHAMLYDNLFNVDAGSFSWQMKKSTLGMSIGRFATDDIPFTDEDGYYDWGTDGIPGTGDPDGTEGNGQKDPGEPVRADAIELRSEGDYLLLLGGAYKISDRIDAGVNVKYLHHDIGGYTSNGFGLDLGAIYRLNSRTNIGVSLRDAIGTRVVWSTDFIETKPPTLNIGGSHRLPLGRHSLKLGLDLESKFENSEELVNLGRVSLKPHVGTELSLFDVFMLRAGLEGKDFTAGAGLKIFNFTVDYAFLTSELDNSHRIGLSFAMPELRPGRDDVPIIPEIPVEEVVVAEEEPTVVVESDEPQVPETPEAPRELPEDKPPVIGDILAEVHFEVGDAQLSPQGVVAVEKAIEIMKRYPAILVDIAGHSDNTPIDTDEFPDNYALSKARANVVLQLLLDAGISRARMSAAGYADEQMRFSGRERYRNRRVEIVVR